MRSRAISALAIACVLALTPTGVGSAAESHDLEALVIEMATTPAQHKAVAVHYRAEAATAKQEAERHRSMGKSYGAGKFAMRQQMQKHCEELAAQYDAQAAKFEELAKLHEQEAGAK